MQDHIYEIHFLFPQETSGVKVPLPMLRLPEVPAVGDILSFEELPDADEFHQCFVVDKRYFHIRKGLISIVTLSLTHGEPGGVLIQKTE